MAAILPVLKMLIVSRTMQGAGAVGGAALVELLPKAATGDPTAIGLTVLAVAGYVRTAYGRWNADRDHRVKRK